MLTIKKSENIANFGKEIDDDLLPTYSLNKLESFHPDSRLCQLKPLTPKKRKKKELFVKC